MGFSISTYFADNTRTDRPSATESAPMSRAKPPGYLPAFCLSVLLPNALLVVLGLTVGGLGAEYGLTYLVWHDDPGKQFWVGFALAPGVAGGPVHRLPALGQEGRPARPVRPLPGAGRPGHAAPVPRLLPVGRRPAGAAGRRPRGPRPAGPEESMPTRTGRTDPAAADTADSHDVPPAAAELRPLAAARGAGGGRWPSSAAGGWPGTPSGSCPRPARRPPRAS